MKRQQREEEAKKSNKGKGFASREEASEGSSRNVFTTDLPIYKMKEKKNRLDVVEHKVKKFNRNADKGDMFHSLVYFVHPDIGPGGRTIVCPTTKGENEACPVCEHQLAIFRSKGKEAAAAFRRKKKIAQVVVDRDDPDKGLQLFLHAYNKGYGEALEKRLNGDDEGKYNNWSDAKKGYFVSFIGTPESVGDDGGKWVTTTTVDLEERKKPLDPKLVKAAPSLDDILDDIPSYEKLKKMLSKASAKDEDAEEEEDTDDEDVEEDDDDSDDSDEEEDDDGEDEEDEAESEDDEDEEGEDDEDDEDEDEEGDDEGSEDLEAGDLVTHGKGKKKREGTIVKIKGDSAQVKFGKKVEKVDLDELEKVEAADDDDDEDEDAEDDDSDMEEEDDDFESDDDDDEDDDDDDDDDEEDSATPRRRKK